MDQSEKPIEHQQEHPRGTLAIVIIFGILLVLAWLATYLYVFLERGAPHS